MIFVIIIIKLINISIIGASGAISSPTVEAIITIRTTTITTTITKTMINTEVGCISSTRTIRDHTTSSSNMGSMIHTRISSTISQLPIWVSSNSGAQSKARPSSSQACRWKLPVRQTSQINQLQIGQLPREHPKHRAGDDDQQPPHGVASLDGRGKRRGHVEQQKQRATPKADRSCHAEEPPLRLVRHNPG